MLRLLHQGADFLDLIIAIRIATWFQQILEPFGMINRTAMGCNQVRWPWQTCLSPATDQAPLETANIRLLEYGELVVDAAADAACHPFGADYRSAVRGEVLNVSADMFDAAIGMECDDIG